MAKKSSPTKYPRVPPRYEGVDVNFCKTPGCKNFGIPAEPIIKRGRPKKGAVHTKSRYKVSGVGKNAASLICNECGRSTVIKSNKGIYEEYLRIWLPRFFLKYGYGCPNDQCSYHTVPLKLGVMAKVYLKHGRTPSGSPRFKCKSCGKTFAVSSPLDRQRITHKNKSIFKLLTNTSPMSRICEIENIWPKMLYDKINFIYRQCRLFSSARETDLSENPRHRLYLCSDRQDYIINWSDRASRKTVQMSAVGTADLTSGYVFGMHLNYDPEADLLSIASDVIQDSTLPFHHRRHARLWTPDDFINSVSRSKTTAGQINDQDEPWAVSDQILQTYQRLSARPDLETPELINEDQQLPKFGAQVHAEYTLFGHFRYLQMMLGETGRLVFFLDQDAGMKPACISSFSDQFKEKRADAFFLKIAKGRTIDERNKACHQSAVRLKAARLQNPNMEDWRIRRKLIKANMRNAVRIGNQPEKWVDHPFPDSAEPEKAVAYLSDQGHLSEDKLAFYIDKASLHAIDTFFAVLRRRSRILERPISPARRERRVWHGYSSYNPEIVQKILEINRVYYNYCNESKKDAKKPTSAMKLGLAKAPIKPETILYFDPYEELRT